MNHSSPPKYPCHIDVKIAKYAVNPRIAYYITLATVLMIIALSTLIFNGAFLYIVLRSRRLQTVHNILLIFLSIIDFFTGAAVTPINAAAFIFVMYEKYPCGLFWFWIISYNTVTIISFTTIALISLEKYVAINHTLYYERVITRRKLLVMAVGACVFGLTLSLIMSLTELSYPKFRKTFLVYTAYSGVVFYIVIFYCYVRIFHEIQKIKRRIAIENTFGNDRTIFREGSKATKTMVVVIGALTLCYLPNFVGHILWAPKHTPRTSEKLVRRIGFTAILFNSTLNPIIYYIRMSLVRREFKRVFGRKRIFAPPQ